MKKSFIHLITFILIQNLFSQSNYYDTGGETNVNYFPQAFIIQSLGNYGYSNSTQINTYNLGNSNPASLSTLDSFSIGLSFQIESKIDPAWIADKNLKATYVGHKRVYNYLPQSFGLYVPVGDIKLGVAFNQIYNSTFLYQPYTLLFTTPENPDGVYRTFKDKSETIISEFSFSIAYSIANLFLQNHQLSLGIKLGLVNTNRFNKIFITEFNENYSGFSWSIGCLYQATEEKMSNLKFGLYYDHNFSSKAKYDYSSVFNYNLYYVTNLPSKIHFGFSGDAGNKIKYFANLSYIFWDSIPADSNNDNKNLKNQLDYSGNLNYQISKMFSATIGVYSTDRVFKNKPSNSFVDEFSAVFIIYGLTTYFNDFDISVILADSHLFSDELRKQTILKVGTNVKL